ncbi:MAG: NAD-dependent epimerase/dehydratase [Butyrivibrio sp.]|nr:NAD-dependent epimerase/dehydratase [Butyrivibrio sp.]
MREKPGRLRMPEKRIAIVTGAFGFAGANLVEHLTEHDYEIYAVGRRVSSHNERLKDLNIHRVFLDMEEYEQLISRLPEDPEGEVSFFHLAWGGDRNDEAVQMRNLKGAMAAIECGVEIDKNLKRRGAGRFRFIGIGSQAEVDPITEYGKYKARAYELLCKKANENGLDFIWARLFSLIGKYEPCGRMLPDLVKNLREGKSFCLSTCEQNWDYLDAADAAQALRLIAERGKSGAVYDVAGGDVRPLREYVEEAADILGADRKLLHFGEVEGPIVNLNPSVKRLKEDTGWTPFVSFRDSVLKY